MAKRPEGGGWGQGGTVPPPETFQQEFGLNSIKNKVREKVLKMENVEVNEEKCKRKRGNEENG